MKSPNVIAGTGTVQRVEVVTFAVSDFVIAPNNASASLQLRNDGTEWTDKSASAPIQVGVWLKRGVVSDYECQYAVSSADKPNAGSAPIDTWIDFSSTRIWNAVETDSPVAIHNVQGTIMIRDAVTLTVLESHSLALVAEVDT